jgi:hypothetical protein
MKMKNRKQTAEGFVNGSVSLPAGFTTGYARDLEVAREMIRLQRDGGEQALRDEADDSESLIRDVA